MPSQKMCFIFWNLYFKFTSSNFYFLWFISDKIPVRIIHASGVRLSHLFSVLFPVFQDFSFLEMDLKTKQRKTNQSWFKNKLKLAWWDYHQICWPAVRNGFMGSTRLVSFQEGKGSHFLPKHWGNKIVCSTQYPTVCWSVV